MILGIGIDIIHLPRLKALLSRTPSSLKKFTSRILTSDESKEFHYTFASILNTHLFFQKKKRWTLKEATYKALYLHNCITWKDVSIKKIKGKPHVTIHTPGNNMTISKTHASVAHDGEYVVAQVMIEGLEKTKLP
ncbi:4'-phosphopantetheinyl transferase [Gigaspora rosea]|uniref:4'-phosphopantetheinyl transferase n=1 Tax=Gigaspora rosea TaxID=44941 RepID=A0A397VKP4_9GLOM|nr:4'-phosphopantetheinyl transferase [Gigaspora rosea]